MQERQNPAGSSSEQQGFTSEDPLTESRRIQLDAASVGFDWPDISGVLSKVREEIGEIEEALQACDIDHAQDELGDLLFAAVNVSRFLRVDPGAALRRANARFRTRFARVKEELARHGLNIQSCTFEQMDEVWERVKGL